MIKKTTIQFNRKNSYEDLGLAITDIPEIPLPNEKVDFISVPGRELGALVLGHGTYEDVEIPISFKISKKHHKEHIDIFHMRDNIIRWLTNVDDNRLIFSFIGNSRCFLVKHIKLGKLTRDLSYWGCFDAEFVCEPFMYEYNELNTFSISIREPQSIYYKGTAPGACCIRIHGSGNIQLTINSETVQINNINNYVELDSRLCKCLDSNGANKFLDMEGNFLKLSPGTNDISWTGNISKIDIKPRTAYK